jgi:two-component system C4-dicarboxylate transport response regulator DctD
VIAASKVDLLEASKAGLFREDLYYRLNVLSIKVPALKQRLEDIPLLFKHFINVASKRHGRANKEVSSDELSRLITHDWPGNVRELQNEATAYVLELPNSMLSEYSQSVTDESSLADKMNAFEKQVIEQTLLEQEGSLKASYEILGVSRKTLYDKMQKHNI